MEEFDSLWFHVIQQAFIDMMNIGESKRNIKIRKEAKKWMNLKNKEFLLTCSFANINPNFVIEIKDRIIKSKKRCRVMTHQFD